MAICSHRRGELRQRDSKGDDGGEGLTQVVTDPISNMLKKQHVGKEQKQLLMQQGILANFG